MKDTAALKDVRAKITDARDRRVVAKRERDAGRAKLENDQLKVGTPEFAAVEEAAKNFNAANEEIEQLQTQENSILSLLGEDVPAPGINGPDSGGEVEQSAALKHLTESPGALLSQIIESRKAHVHTIPENLRVKASMFEMTAPTQITTQTISTTTETAAIIDLLAPQSVALASGINVLRIDTTKQRVPRFTQLPEASWIPELGEFPESAPAIEMVTVEPPKVGLISPLSIEVFEDLTPLALSMTQTQILRAIGLAYDHGILFGSGLGSEPLGIAKTAGIAAIEGPPLRNFAAFAEAIGALLVANTLPKALVMNPLDIAKLLEAVEWNGQEPVEKNTQTQTTEHPAGSNIPLWKASLNSISGLTLPYFGIPVWPTPACPSGEALMYDPAQVLAVIRKQADIAIDPYYEFKKGKVGLRSFLRGSVVVGQPKAAVRIKFKAN